MRDTTPPEKAGVTKIHEAMGDAIRTSTGPLSPLVEYIWPSFHQKEIEKWREKVHARLEELAALDHEFTLDELSNNQEFTAVLIQASQTAARNFQDKKLEYLKNIIINTPSVTLSSDLKLTFLNFVDELSVNHIALLSILSQHIDAVKTLLGYPQLFQYFVEQHDCKWSRHEFKMYLLALESRGLLSISRDFNDYEDEVFESSKLVAEDSENSGRPFIMVMETGNQFLDFILAEKTKSST